MVCYLLYQYDDDQKPCLKVLQFTEMKRQDPNSYRSIRELQQRDLSLMKSFWFKHLMEIFT
jgi:hypothetical protein